MENLRIEVSPNHPPRQGLVWERRVWSQQLGPKDFGPLHLQGVRPFMHHSCPNIRCLGLKVTWLQGSSFLSYFRSVHLWGHNSVKCECMMPFGIMQPRCYTKHLTKFSRLKWKNSAAFLGLYCCLMQSSVREGETVLEGERGWGIQPGLGPHFILDVTFWLLLWAHPVSQEKT